MKQRILSLLGWGLSSPFALKHEWSLPEFCWSTWLAALAFCYACVLTGLIEIIFLPGRHRETFKNRVPFFEHLSDTAGSGIILLSALAAAAGAYYIYTMIFFMFGLFLSVFAEMDPTSYFGRNGFINSNFFEPALYLSHRLWPMVAGTLLANAPDFSLGSPWERFLIPLHKEAARLHLFILALPFVTMATWAWLGKSYEPAAVVTLSLLYYLFSRKHINPAKPNPSCPERIKGPA